jgi:hypothetical protein
MDILENADVSFQCNAKDLTPMRFVQMRNSSGYEKIVFQFKENLNKNVLQQTLTLELFMKCKAGVCECF